MTKGVPPFSGTVEPAQVTQPRGIRAHNPFKGIERKESWVSLSLSATDLWIHQTTCFSFTPKISSASWTQPSPDLFSPQRNSVGQFQSSHPKSQRRVEVFKKTFVRPSYANNVNPGCPFFTQLHELGIVQKENAIVEDYAFEWKKKEVWERERNLSLVFLFSDSNSNSRWPENESCENPLFLFICNGEREKEDGIYLRIRKRKDLWIE